MFQKIKDFFSSKVVKIVAWVVLALDVTALIIGGATTVEITDGIALIAGVIAAVSLVIAFIAERIKK
jgi:predicted ferric reductase